MKLHTVELSPFSLCDQTVLDAGLCKLDADFISCVGQDITTEYGHLTDCTKINAAISKLLDL
jgi:hypothetical protein